MKKKIRFRKNAIKNAIPGKQLIRNEFPPPQNDNILTKQKR